MKQLITRWGKALDPARILPEYPRPQLVRMGAAYTWKSLNGYWKYKIEKAVQDSVFPAAYDGDILVPFSPETFASGIGRQLQPDEVLWYRTAWQGRHLANGSSSSRLLLHFGAVDQTAVIYVNSRKLASHTGGYLPFTVDITDAVCDAENELIVRVTDTSDTSYHSRGKQKLQRGGMYYTAVSGIWQTVWLEEVPAVYLSGLTLTPDLDAHTVTILAEAGQAASAAEASLPFHVHIYAPAQYPEADQQLDESKVLCEADGVIGKPLTVELPDVKPWTPDNPWLYYVDLRLEGADSASADISGTDCVRSYFAMRSFTVETKTLPEGHASDAAAAGSAVNTGSTASCPRLCLNHEPLFQRGVLDQGYWPESILTSPSDEAMIFDIAEMKATGFNMVRKHIKIEPDRWYYHCDRLGIIVWQDMVNGGGRTQAWFVTYLATAMSAVRFPVSDRLRPLLSRTDKAGRQEFEAEMIKTIRLLKNHPSIAVWVIFNEGWGQFDTNRLTGIARAEDPTRIIDQASGWFDQKGGDLVSIHNYFFKLRLFPEKKRANVLSEIGGYTLGVEGHICTEKEYGYSTYTSHEELNAAYQELSGKCAALIPQGLCATVYTQWTDIEDEINGVYTYDREVRKIDFREK